MTGFVLPPAPVPSVPVEGATDRFAVRRIFCVGRNYADHAREMGHDPDREPPFFFTKPADALLTGDADLPWPPATQDLHFEGELVVALGAGGSDIAAAKAGGLIWGYAAGNDLTRRDLQAEAKRMGRPWDMAKGFDGSAVCGPLQPGAPADDARLVAEVNGQVRQDGRLSQMIWPVAEIIAHLSRLVRLEPGDLIFTGTPAGVGALQPGDEVVVRIEGLAPGRTRLLG
ncbi:fumarylacetoacetate hydrolase family protein [Paracoccus gahaiensis]|uniref:Fumarylacetoacetate hydrolase family protein n=1 Tax=Paracoccus gahaiensis TaxID=1706839 RepID=A0A4U0RFF4_9RHOB|nr:fumarylacetoacetate hydrolase family protein [Paracoccus gahaiensis]TJZ94221.1 fumarylacetoacetate hydrolase family protein [Paracoccus gahaiensis]